jgi:hypothetical protein
LTKRAPGWSARGHGIDPFGGDLLAPAPLQGFVYTDHQWAAGHEDLHEHTQQYTTRLPTRPNGAVEDAMVALEVLDLPQAHNT